MTKLISKINEKYLIKLFYLKFIIKKLIKTEFKYIKKKIFNYYSLILKK